MKKIILFCAVAGLLAACGGNGGDANNPTVSLPPPLNTGGTGDAFIDYVVAVIAVEPDSPPTAIESVAVTAPDVASPYAFM